ncbi:hypothetical protein EIP86_005963 [Pleurotus ostreatoroseus]|nr:hypothetical protein EIP86_005963 [Pleurotus ostreatoroseus]
MAKSTTERPTKVKKTTKATAADPPAKPSKTLRSSIVVEAEATTRTKSAEELIKPSKKRKAAVEDTGNVAANTLSKTKKPKREAETKGEEPKDTEKVTAKEDVKQSKGRKNSDKTKTDKVEAQSEAIAEGVEAEVEVEGVQEEEEVEFFGFATDDEDSSDEEDLDAEPEGVSVSKLPTVAKDDAIVKQKLEKAKRKAQTGDRGVIYLGRIPHGFYEDQMKAYFTQFGDVTRLRLSRSKKTGRSKHYAFIEFDSSEVAKIVAETMDNYLLMGHILRCKVIPKDEVHPELWVGANRKWRVVPHDRISRLEHNKARSEEEQEQAEKRLLRRQQRQKQKIVEAGIKYDFEAVAYKKSEKPAKA